MKKLFVSVPMKGRTKENIKNSIECMHKIEDLHDIVSQVVHDSTLDISVIEDDTSIDSVESINCPYCGKTIVGLPELHEVGNHIITCPNCHNKFILKTSISYHYDVSERMEITNDMKESTNV